MKSQIHILGSHGAACLAALALAVVSALGQPVNDMFANRTVISGTSVTVYGNNTGATKEPGEPNHPNSTGGASVWWSWQAPAAGTVQISTTGSSFDTILAVYTGSSVSSLTLVAYNDDDPDSTDFTSKVTFSAAAGVTYQIAVDGYAGVSGAITLNVKQFVPPANDLFVNRAMISGTNVTVQGANFSATKEPGEPNHAGDPGGASVWWSWVAPAAGPVQITTAGSTFDTLLAVYVGSSLSGLTEVASNDDDPDTTDRTSKVVFNAVAGQTYQIAVDGWGGAVGNITLRLQQPAPPTPPPPPAPTWQLSDPYGVTVRSTDFAGKVVMFNFWATWCGPCRAEMPDMVGLQADYGADGLVIIGADLGESAQTIQSFLATLTPAINYHIVMSDSATEYAFGGTNGIPAIPRTFIIDRNNGIPRSFLGSQTRASFESAIIPLLYSNARLGCDTSGGQTLLRWPVTAKPFVLESATSLVNPSWTQWPTQSVVINGTNQVQVPAGGNYFFRLRMSY